MSEGNGEFGWPNGKRAAVSLTFDDARLTQVSDGFPILTKHDVKATFYVTIKFMEQRLDAWREAVAFGHEIANHTVAHPCTGNFVWSRDAALEDYTFDTIGQDILEANEIIEELVGVTPKTFAYPCGQHFVGRGREQRSYVPFVAEHFMIGRGYNMTVLVDPLRCDPAYLPAPNFDRLSWPAAKALIDDARQEGRWLILAGHEVADEGRQAVIPDTLDRVCAYCNDPDNGVWLDTVANVGRHVVTHPVRGD